MQRHWIKAPSTRDTVHHWNGRKVLCDVSQTVGSCVTVYFVDGDTISALIPKKYLSKTGW